MFAFKCEVCAKNVQQNSSTDKQLFQLSNCRKCMKTCPQPWLPLINGLVNDALLELSPERNHCFRSST